MDALPGQVVVTDYSELVAAIRERVEQTGVTFYAVDDLSGLPDRYFAKLVGVRPTKHFGFLSLFSVLPVLGLKLALVPDDELLARMQRRSDWVKSRYPQRRRARKSAA